MRSRTVRTSQWHAVRVTVERNSIAGEPVRDIRINSMPDAVGYPGRCSAYLTPQKARELAAVLIAAAKEVELKP